MRAKCQRGVAIKHTPHKGMHNSFGQPVASFTTQGKAVVHIIDRSMLVIIYTSSAIGEERDTLQGNSGGTSLIKKVCIHIWPLREVDHRLDGQLAGSTSSVGNGFLEAIISHSLKVGLCIATHFCAVGMAGPKQEGCRSKDADKTSRHRIILSTEKPSLTGQAWLFVD